MSQFLVKGKHFTRNHIWFEDAAAQTISGDYDVLILHGNPVAVEKIGSRKCQSELQRTAVTDLTKSEEELFSLVTKSIRNHVNRSKRENVQIAVYRDAAELEPVLKDFAEMYHGMFLEKGMPDRFLEVNELQAYAAQGALVVSTASIDGDVVRFNAYIHNGSQARALYSCSQFRSVEKDVYQAIGRAGEYLDWMDLLYCKQMGVTEFDWGGITSFEEPNSIDKYKMKFGVEFREYYNLTCICSFRAKVYYLLRSLLGKD